MKFTIPKEVVDAETGSRDDTFPAGTWQGIIEIVRTQEVERGADGPQFFLQKDGVYFADSCEVASIQIGENEGVLEGQPDIGGMKFFDGNLILSYDGENWDDYERSDDDPKWRLGMTQMRLTKLAQALGLTDENDDGVGPVDNFNELLRDTDDGMGLNGMAVRYKVAHRKFKRRDGTDGKEAQIVKFYPAG